MYIGCGSFLLTGSQVVNKFIGGNVSANSGREQLMAMLGFGHGMKTIASTGVMGVAGAGLLGTGALIKGGAKASSVGNSAIGKAGKAISSFGNKIGGDSGSMKNNMGNHLKIVGDYMQTSSLAKKSPTKLDGRPNNKLSRFGNDVMNAGKNSMHYAMNNVIPSRNMYRRRYGRRDD